VELDGYTYHTSRAGWLKDIDKFNEALILGWRVLHVTPKMVENGQADSLLNRAILELVEVKK
jgi:hypothetical protein